jgi:primosomal protein N' (replication factor Y)
MDERIGDSRMPVLDIVDMRKETASGNLSVFSRELISKTDRSLKRGEQVIFFLNRRGFSTQILCPDCGSRMTCPDCGITLTYHRSSNAAVCHYCSRKFPLPEACPDCGSRYIKYVGAGTEKVEDEAKRLWPDHTVSRFDTDTVSAGEILQRSSGTSRTAGRTYSSEHRYSQKVWISGT